MHSNATALVSPELTLLVNGYLLYEAERSVLPPYEVYVLTWRVLVIGQEVLVPAREGSVSQREVYIVARETFVLPRDVLVVARVRVV